jgi:transcriptional regulator with XRE-family HTH domain
LVTLLRDLRLEAELSQVDVATAIKRPQTHVSAIEVGQRGLDLLQVRELAGLYGVPLRKFVDLFEQRLASEPYRPPRRVRRDAVKKVPARGRAKKKVGARKR